MRALPAASGSQPALIPKGLRLHAGLARGFPDSSQPALIPKGLRRRAAGHHPRIRWFTTSPDSKGIKTISQLFFQSKIGSQPALIPKGLRLFHEAFFTLNPSVHNQP